MPRKNPRLGFNATSSPPGVDSTATAGEALAPAEAVAQEEAYQETLAEDTERAHAARSLRSFQAHAAVPRTITDNVSPRSRTRFKDASEVRAASNYSRRTLSRDRNTAFAESSAARSRSLAGLRDEGRRAAKVGELNEALRVAGGDPDGLPSNLRSRQEDIDRTIRTAETANTREHTVYVAADMSGLPGDTPDEKIASARTLIEDSQGAYPVNGYMFGAHDMSEAVNEDNPSELVMEVKTASGVYLGNSDGGIHNTTHLVGRNRYLKPVGIQEGVPYERPDGTRGTRTVIQMVDVTPDVWDAVHAND